MRNKKLCILLLIVFIGCLSITGYSQDKIEIKLGHNAPRELPHGMIFEYFKMRVEEIDPSITIKIYPNAVLGSEREMLESVQFGSLEMAKVMTSVTTAVCPEFKVLDLPYLFPTRQHMWMTIKGPIGDCLNKCLEEQAGVKNLFWQDQSTRNIYTNKPVKTPEDLKGMKIRVMKSSVMVDTLNAMGASATPMAFGEVYSAIRQGVLDGAENAPMSIESNKHYEVAKYINLTHHFRTPTHLLVNLNFWKNKLTQQNRDAILQAAQEAEEWGLRYVMARDREAMSRLENYGMTVINCDIEAFMKSVESVYKKNKDIIPGNFIDRILAYVGSVDETSAFLEKIAGF
jgi:tripartite ATP-independent transporter DctP family solute receptor